MDIRLIVATLFAVTIAFSNGAKRDGVMRKIYALETLMHEDISYLRDAVDTNRVSIDTILQLLNNSQSGAVVNQQQPEANNDPYDDARFSEELARFKRAFADEKAIAREQQANLMLGMRTLSDAISKHLDRITDVVSKLDNRLDGISDDVSKLNNRLDGITDVVSQLDNQFEGVTGVVSNLDNRLTNIEQDIGNISNLIKHSTSNTADLVKVVDVVGNMEQTVLETFNASCNHDSKSLIKMYTGVVDELSTSPCLSLFANKKVYSIVNFPRTVRLANASCTTDGAHVQGRVEVYHNGVWGTVCDDEIRDNNNGATVVCRSLGFRSGIVKIEAYFGQGSGNTWLDNVECDGTEDDIFNCPRKNNPAIGKEDCSHAEDVGVICR